MPGHTAHVPRSRVMNDSAVRLAANHLRGGGARQFGRWREVAGVGHFQRLKNFPRDKLFKRSFAYPLHNLAQEKKINVTVPKGSSRPTEQFFLTSLGDGGGLSVPIGLSFDIAAQTRKVHH